MPIYQRHYVWEVEKQLAGFWEDLETKARARLAKPDEQPPPHYLGALVLADRVAQNPLRVPVKEVIDGQQRITTLQLPFAALRDVARAHGLAMLARSAEKCLRDPDPEDMEVPEEDVHRLWPTHHDRETYAASVEAGSRDEVRRRFSQHFPRGGQRLKKVNLKEQPNLLKAYLHLHDALDAFVGTGEEAEVDARLKALPLAFQSSFRVVTIGLEGEDDPQAIFESLNDGGRPLLAFDLVRNHVFMRAARALQGAKAEKLYDERWKPLEDRFRTGLEQRGRLKRPRIEFFMLQYLAARTGHACARTLPSAVQARIRSRSMSAMPPSTACIIRLHCKISRILKWCGCKS